MTGCNKKQCYCNSNVEKKSTESDNESYTPPGIGLSSFCHISLSQEADSFGLLLDSGSLKHFIDPELIRGVETRMQEYITTNPHMEVKAAGDNVL